MSFEVGMTDLGGHSLYLDRARCSWEEVEEAVEDTARILSGYVQGIMIRAKSHLTVMDIAKNSKVPVINGLTDKEHPCQILADLLTIRERKGKLKGLKLAWIGDGNNVCSSWVLAAAIMDMKISIASARI